jgi:proteasome beta subunit
MNVPLFSPADDPGPDFAALMRSLGIGSPVLSGPVPAGAALQSPTSHATTVVAVRYRDGVVMAGDRRATMGNIISHRSIEKVFPADRHSGVAIAGAAGPAMEMVKLFQLQLEHYEKVEGSALSLEGKANQLAQMVRSHLPAAMQGLAVVPLFAGYDTARGAGRLFQYDMTGGRYEETNFATTGSGGMLASTVIKVGFADDMPRDTAVDLVIDALFRAADDDSATGGPDLVRGIYPTVATITAEGFTRVGESEVANRFAELTTRLRLANPVSAETTDDRGDR